NKSKRTPTHVRFWYIGFETASFVCFSCQYRFDKIMLVIQIIRIVYKCSCYPVVMIQIPKAARSSCAIINFIPHHTTSSPETLLPMTPFSKSNGSQSQSLSLNTTRFLNGYKSYFRLIVEFLSSLVHLSTHTIPS